MSDDRPIKLKEQRFCAEYTVDYNGTQAAIRAGYKEKSAAKAACLMLKRPEIMAEIRKLQEEQCERLCLTSDLVVIRTIDLLNKCMANVPVMEWDYEEHKMVRTGEYQVDSRGAGKALELLAKMQGMLDGGRGSNEATVPVILTGEADIKD